MKVTDPGLKCRSRSAAFVCLGLAILFVLLLWRVAGATANPVPACPPAPTPTVTPSPTPTPTPGPNVVRLSSFTAFSGGNRGGCGRNGRNLRTRVQCNVTDAGRGFVSGACVDGLWFSRVATARTFRIGDRVVVRGCEGLYGELYAPISISRR